MLRSFKRLSIATQAFCALLLMLLGTMSALYFWATDNAMESELSHTRTVADMADAFRAQASKHGGFYVRRESSETVRTVGRFLAAFDVDVAQPDGTSKHYTFHQKNPFLALGDFSAEVQKSPAAAKFRMVSDNYMNPANKPDAFEAEAIRTLRESAKLEHWGVVDGQLRYARALKATKACLSCHGSPEAAPAAVRTQYQPVPGSAVGGGYGYTEGDIVGLTSVTVAHKTPWQMLASQRLGFWLSAFFVMFLMALSYIFVVRAIAKPLRSLSRYANQMVKADDLKNVRAPVFDKSEYTSKNELHLQSHALKSLHESMQAAFDYIKGKR